MSDVVSEEARLLLNEIIGNITATSSFLLCLAPVVTVVRKSPAVMGAYKWYIVVNAVVSTSFSTANALLRPEPIFEYHCLVFGGAFRNVQLSDATALIVTNIMMLHWLAMNYTLLLMFCYRYAQTAHPRICRWLSSYRIAVPSAALVCTFCAVIAMVPINYSLKPCEEVLATIADANIDLYRSLSARTVVGLPMAVVHVRTEAVGHAKDAGPNWFQTQGSEFLDVILSVGTLLMLSLILIIVFCTYGCYRSLESRRASLLDSFASPIPLADQCPHRRYDSMLGFDGVSLFR